MNKRRRWKAKAKRLAGVRRQMERSAWVQRYAPAPDVLAAVQQIIERRRPMLERLAGR